MRDRGADDHARVGARWPGRIVAIGLLLALLGAGGVGVVDVGGGWLRPSDGWSDAGGTFREDSCSPDSVPSLWHHRRYLCLDMSTPAHGPSVLTESTDAGHTAWTGRSGLGSGGQPREAGGTGAQTWAETWTQLWAHPEAVASVLADLMLLLAALALGSVIAVPALTGRAADDPRWVVTPVRLAAMFLLVWIAIGVNTDPVR